LLDCILNLKKQPFDEGSKVGFYEKVFEKKYFKDKDYLLRNELKLLSQQQA